MGNQNFMESTGQWLFLSDGHIKDVLCCLGFCPNKDLDSVFYFNIL